MPSRLGRAAIVALAAQGAIARPRKDGVLSARAPQATTPTTTAVSSVIPITATSAATTSVDLPILPTYTPSDGGTLSCPADDRQPYNDPSGKQYTVSCYTDYFDYVDGLNYTVSLEGCATVCSADPACLAAVFRPGASNGPCYLKTGLGFASQDLGLMAIIPNNETFSSLALTTAASSYTTKYGTTNTAEPVTLVTVQSTYTVASTITVTTPVEAISSTLLDASSVTIIAPTSTSTVTSISIAPLSFTTITPVVTVTSTLVASLSLTTVTAATSSAGPISVPSIPAIPVDRVDVDKVPYAPCGKLNHKGNTFYLRTHVIYGNNEFENLYVQSITYGAPPQIPTLLSNRNTAAQVYFDYTTTSVAIWQGNCTFTGLKMNRDRDMNSWSPVLVGDETGSSKMSIAYGELWWDNDRFGSWLICKDPSTAAYQLLWWDTIVDQGIDATRCAKVQLLTENL